MVVRTTKRRVGALALNEVAPPGWGHTKAEKEKTKPNKPKSKIGGSAAEFKKDLDSGKFKGLPGDKTKKEKTASMFKLMWSMKKKGYKPHYKPGTDEKYKKYQEEKEMCEKCGSMEHSTKDCPRDVQEGKSWKAWKTAAKAAIGKKTPKHNYGKDAGAEAAKRLRKRDHEKVNFLDPED